MKIRRIWAFILMITILLGNTMSVSATSSSVSGNKVINSQIEECGNEDEIEITDEDHILLNELSEATETIEEDSTTVSQNEILIDEEESEVADIPIMNYGIMSTNVSPMIDRPSASWSLEGLGGPVYPESEIAYWNGPILVLGDSCGESYTNAYTDREKTYTSYWRLLDATNALIMADGILQNGKMMYGGTSWEETDLFTYLNGEFVGKDPLSGDSANAIYGDIRIPKLNEITNPIYGYANSSNASYTRVYGMQYAIMPDDGEGEPYYVEKTGSIAVPDEEYYPTTYGFIPTMQLDVSKICLAVKQDIASDSFARITNPNGNVYQLFLQKESDFVAILPKEANQGDTVDFSVETSGGEEYNHIYAVLTNKKTKEIVAFGTVEGEVGTGHKSFYLNSDIPAGDYLLTVFEAKWDSINTSAYAGTSVSTDFTIKGPAIGEFEVFEQQYGSIKLYWTLEYVTDTSAQTYTSCNIYRAESEDGEYRLLEEAYPCNNSDGRYFYVDEKDILSENGSNKTLYYKICMLHSGVETEQCLYATNKGMCYGPANGEYAGMYLAISEGDTNQSLDIIDSLLLCPEEYEELQVVLLDRDGNTVTGTGEMEEDSTSWYICTQPVKDSADAMESDGNKIVSNSLLEIVPIDFNDEIHVGIVAHDAVEVGQNYYLMAQCRLPNKETYWAQIPITIVAAKPGDSFDKMPGGEDGIYLSADELLVGTTVKVSRADADTGMEVVKEYISLEDAVAGLKTDFAQKSGSYTVIFTDNTKLNGNVSFPSYVKELHLKAESKDGTGALLVLDLGGYAISTSAVVNIYNDLHITNTTATTSKVTTTAKNGADGYTVRIAQSESANTEHLSNITLSAANGTVLFNGTNENEIISQFHRADVAITAKEVQIASGKWKLGTVTATNFVNNAVTHVTKINNVTNFYNKEEKVLVVDTYTQNSKGTTRLEAVSALVIRNTATIYNTAIGASDTGNENRNVYVYSVADRINENGKVESLTGAIAFEGKVTAEENAKLDFVVLANEEAINLLTDGAESLRKEAIVEAAPRTKLFTSSIKVFPVELIGVNTGIEQSAYTEVYQQDKNILVGREWITIYTKQIDGSEEPIQSFVRWSDAATYLNTLANTPMEYIVEITEDIEMTTALTLPSKVKGITFRGNAVQTIGEGSEGADARVDISYTGDIKLLSDTTFENITLSAKKYNSKTKVYDDYKSALNLNGKVLEFINSQADFASVAGNANACMDMTDSEILVAKAVSSLGFLVMKNAKLEAVGNIAVTNTLTMESSELISAAIISLKDVVTNDEKNHISYGGNTSKNILTIAGNVTSEDESDEKVRIKKNVIDENGEMVLEEAEGTARKNAICLSVASMEVNGYIENALICNAAKAGAGWFVIGSEWEEDNNGQTKVVRVISNSTYKKGNAVYCGEIVENVKLYSYKISENEQYILGDSVEYVWESSFATLQEAFSEIDKLALSDRYYLIEIKTDDENVVTFNNKALTFPSKTKGVIVSSSGEDRTANIYYKDALTLKSDMYFEGIVFVPTTAAAVSLGKYKLTLSGCQVDTSKAAGGFNALTGSGVTGTSELTLLDTDLHITGAVNGIGTLTYAVGEVPDGGQPETETMSVLKANAAVNVGDIVLEEDGKLIGLASVSRSKGVVTKVTPQITVNGEVYSGAKEASDKANTLYLDLQEVVSKKYVLLDFDAAEMETVLRTGLMLAKAMNVTYPNIKAWQRTGEVDLVLVKSAGYLTHFENGYGAELSYVENGESIVIPCRTFADAVTEINNRKTKREYTITLTKNMAEISGADRNGSNEVPKALTMPNKNYVSLLTITAEADALGKYETSSLGFLNNITFTSNVILDNVQFVQMVKVGSDYKAMDVAKDNYPAAMTLNTGGYELTVLGDITFNTPVNLNGSSKGILTFDENGTIKTLTNDYDGENSRQAERAKNVIYGTITDFATVGLDGVEVSLREYASARGSSKYTASSSSITTLNMSEAAFIIVGDKAKGAFSNTNLNMDNSSLVVGGKVNLKNVTLEGAAKAAISADTDFNITGTLTSYTDNAILSTRLKGSGKAPYLNISGSVVRSNDSEPIHVEVFNENGAIAKNHVMLMDAPKVTAQLLTAKNAEARDFAPHVGNYSGGEYSEHNTNGYMMFKSGSNIYVYNGSKVYAAVYEGEDTFVGYYPSQKDAAAAINTLKDKTRDYTIVLMQENGTVASPVGITIPSYANTVTLTSLNEECSSVYLSGSITLNAKTILKNLTFIPVSKSKAIAFSIAAGGYDLTLTDVETSTGQTVSGTASLKDISGKGTQTIIWNSPELVVSGSINSAAKLIVNEDARVDGTLKVTNLQMNNAIADDQAKPVTLATKGTVTIGNIDNRGEAQNVLSFGRNAKNITNLTINKEISNEEATLLLKQNEGTAVASLSKSGSKVALSDAKKLAVMPLAATDSFKVADNTLTVVKANKGIYLADATAVNDMVVVTRNTQAAAEEMKYNCLDYVQAVNEINNLSDATSVYTIKLAAGEDSSIGADTNVTDGNPYGAFPMPSANKVKSLLIAGITDSQTGKPITLMTFTGGITGYGEVVLKDMILNPVKGAADKTSVDTKITLSADKSPATVLTLNNVNTLVKTAESTSTTGFLASIGGTKNKTDVVLKNCGNLIIKSGITNVDEVTVDGTHLLSSGATTVNTVILGANTSWNSLGKLTANYATMPADHSAYLGVKQDKNFNPQFVLNNDVNAGGLLVCRVYNASTTLADDETIFAGNCVNEVETYGGVSLAFAKKANADKIRAYAFRPANATGGFYKDGESSVAVDGLISYKVGELVKNGDINSMAVKVSRYSEKPEGTGNQPLSTFYAESFDACTTIINNIGDMNSYYDIEFIQAPADGESQVVVKTTKNGTAYGAWTLPTKAAGLTIRGHAVTNGDTLQKTTVVKYTGAFKPSCDVTLENIYITEGKTDSKALDGFVESGSVTPTPASNKAITFTDSVFVAENDEALEQSIEDKLVFSSVNSSKGQLILDHSPVTVKGAMTIGTLHLEGGITADVAGKISITDLFVDTGKNQVASPVAIAIGNVSNVGSADGKVLLSTCFTKITKAGTYGTSQLTISGLISNTKLQIQPMSYDLTSTSYQKMTATQVENLLVKTAAKPDAYRRFAVVSKASLDNVSLVAGDAEYVNYVDGKAAQKYLYKYETGLYLTDLSPVVEVVGYTASNENGANATYSDACYNARFLSWDQAVKEIDKIGNASCYYEMIVLDTIGYENNSQGVKICNAMGTVTMPTKAAQVTIASEDGEQNGVFFTGSTMTAKCPVILKNVGFTRVKQNGKGESAYFTPLTYTFNIGNYRVIMVDMVENYGGISTTPYTISGSSKGILECPVAEGMNADSITFAAIKGTFDLVVTEGMTVNSEGDLSVKNLVVTKGEVKAKNVAVSTTATLDKAHVQAGASAGGTGKMTFKDIVIAGLDNRFTAKQDAQGKSLITINGTVTALQEGETLLDADNAIAIMLLYNNSSMAEGKQKPVQMYKDVILCTAPKASSSMFSPVYTAAAGQVIDSANYAVIGMGKQILGYGTYKSGKNICYGAY